MIVCGPAKSSCRGHLGLQRRPKVTGSFGHGRPGGLGSSAGCRSSQPGAEQATTQGSGQLLEVFRALEDPAGQRDAFAGFRSLLAELLTFARQHFEPGMALSTSVQEVWPQLSETSDAAAARQAVSSQHVPSRCGVWLPGMHMQCRGMSPRKSHSVEC